MLDQSSNLVFGPESYGITPVTLLYDAVVLTADIVMMLQC